MSDETWPILMETTHSAGQAPLYYWMRRDGATSAVYVTRRAAERAREAGAIEWARR